MLGAGGIGAFQEVCGEGKQVEGRGKDFWEGSGTSGERGSRWVGESRRVGGSLIRVGVINQVDGQPWSPVGHNWPLALRQWFLDGEEWLLEQESLLDDGDLGQQACELDGAEQDGEGVFMGDLALLGVEVGIHPLFRYENVRKHCAGVAPHRVGERDVHALGIYRAAPRKLGLAPVHRLSAEHHPVVVEWILVHVRPHVKVNVFAICKVVLVG